MDALWAVVLSKEELDALYAMKLEHLRAEIKLGLGDLERGANRDYEVEDLPELGERIKAAGRKAFEVK